MHPGLASGVTDGGGNVTVPISHQKVGVLWRIYQLAVNYAGGGSITVQLQVNGYEYSSVVLITSGQAASGDPACDIGRTDTLGVVLTGGPPNINVIVSYYYDELPDTTGS